MKGTKYMANGGGMKGTKYKSMGGGMKSTKGFSKGGAALQSEMKANPGMDKMPASILAKLQAGLSPVSGGKTKSLAKALGDIKKKKPAKKFPPKAR